MLICDWNSDHTRHRDQWQMTDMQTMDDLNSFLPQANEINFAEDWKLLANFSPSNFFIPLFLSLITLLFGIGYVAGYFADKRMAKDLDALEQRMYLLDGDVTTDFEGEVRKKRTCKHKCLSYWKCWECNKVRYCNGAHTRRNDANSPLV